MKIRKQVNENCDKCGHYVKTIQHAAEGCDWCEKEMDMENESPLNYTIFYNNTDKTKHMHFCSWKCVFFSLKKEKCDHFISLPFLSFEENDKGRTVKDFFDCIKST